MNANNFYKSPDTGHHNVLLKKGELIDPSRNDRVVPYKIYYPKDADEKLPVIIWSHGFGGNRDGAAFLSRYVASHGYVLVHLTHYGTDSSLWEGKPGHPWDILRKTKVSRSTTIDRFRDVPFLLDRLPDLAGEHGDAGAVMDLERLGMSGHSFGAMTTQVMAGMRFPDEEGKLVQMKEPRFRSGILYSPVPIGHLTDEDPAALYGPIDLPLLYQTGTDDDSPVEGFDYKTRLAVHAHAKAPEKHLLIKNDGDHMVYNGTRGKLEANPKREKHEEIIKLASLAFWDMSLKNDGVAKEWLTGQGMQEFIKGEGEYRLDKS